jgi:hypothetical protein
MKIIFYSDKCENCVEIIKYLDIINFKLLYKIININDDNSSNEYSNIISIINDNILPVLIDTELNQPIKGNIVYEYLKNQKFFNISTNNIENIIPNNPIINEDMKAYAHNQNLLSISNNEEIDNIKNNQEITNINKFKHYLIKKRYK